jgi:YidC/Oxa1 family membrane protein insertase
MDRKSIFVLIACFALLFLGSQLINKMYPPVPVAPGAPGATNASGQVSAPLSNAPAPAVLSSVDTNRTVTPIHPARPLTGPEQTLVITNTNARYTFTSRGGGLSTIELVKYPETVKRKKTKADLQDFATLNTPHAAPVLALFGDPSLQDDGQFVLTQTDNGVRAEKVLTNGLRLVKEFKIGTNYLFHTKVRLENTSSQPLILSAQEWAVGTATPMDPDDHALTHGTAWYNGRKMEEKAATWFINSGFLFWGGTPRPEFRAGQSNVVWTAAQNQFFVLAAMLPTNALAFVSRSMDLPRPAEGWYSHSENPPPKGFQNYLLYPATTIPAGEALEQEIHFYAGPKEYRTLARIASRFQNNVDHVMGFNGFFGFFSKALLLSMNWLHNTLSLPYGWAIIVITVIIKGLFWPITAAQTRMSRRMAALQPQMKAIQEKYKDDPLKAQKKIGEFWKEHKINPLSGCLPLLLQMPVFFGFFFMIRTAIELRGAKFLWVADLSKPDTLFVIPGLNFIPFLATPEGLPFNLLPLLMGVTMLWQAHLMPPSPGMDPTQQKIMKYMPAMFILFLYNYSAGLALYWTVQNLLSVLQTKFTKIDPPKNAPAAPATSPALTPVSKKKK